MFIAYGYVTARKVRKYYCKLLSGLVDVVLDDFVVVVLDDDDDDEYI